MMLDLVKGLQLDLSKVVGLTKVSIGANWGKIVTDKGFLGFGGSKESVDLDISAISYDANGNYRSTVYFGNQDVPGISLDGDDQTGDDDNDELDNETITIDLSEVSSQTSTIVFSLISYKQQPFGALPYARLRLYDADKSCLATTNIDITADEKFKSKTSMVFARLDRTTEGWTYKAVCEPTEYKTITELRDKAINF